MKNDAWKIGSGLYEKLVGVYNRRCKVNTWKYIHLNFEQQLSNYICFRNYLVIIKLLHLNQTTILNVSFKITCNEYEILQSNHEVTAIVYTYEVTAGIHHWIL